MRRIGQEDDPKLRNHVEVHIHLFLAIVVELTRERIYARHATNNGQAHGQRIILSPFCFSLGAVKLRMDTAWFVTQKTMMK